MTPATLRVLLACALAALLAAPAAAQDRPSEDDLFGAPPPESLVERSRAQDDTLALGGQLYLRSAATFAESTAPADWPLSSPNLVDLYLDARPNDRVRGFVLARTSYDPTLEGAATAASPLGEAVPGLAPPAPENPRVVLDQLWLNFDLGRRAFLTVGKQHVKWGVGRFWNPTDYLHPVRRDPLAVFDARTGTTMVKLHVPWEKRGWNVYGVAMLADAGGRPEPVDRVGRVATGARAELVLGPAELGLDALVQGGRKPRFGVDLSAGVWELDVYAEVALRRGVDVPRWREVDPDATSVLARYARDDPDGFTPQVVVGGSWSRNYTDEDVITVGAEWFHDRTGYEDAGIYPVLLAAPVAGRLLQAEGERTGDAALAEAGRALAAEQPFSPFYLGRHYAGAFVALPAPGRWNDTTFTLSALANLSDGSAVARLDHSVLLLTYLRLETHVAGHLGTKGGEFRLGFDVPAQTLGDGLTTPAFRVPAPVLDLGVALRVSL